MNLPDILANAAAAKQALMQMRPAKLTEQEYICNGVYVRVLIIPKGTTVGGAKHLTEHLAIIASGECYVTDFTGKYHYKGFNVFTSPAGVERVAHMVEDTVWITVHHTHETDLEKITELLVDTPRKHLANGAESLQKNAFEEKRRARYAQIKQECKPDNHDKLQQLCTDFNSS